MESNFKLKNIMKYALKTFKDGVLCFLFTPILMFILYGYTRKGIINADSELPSYIEMFINWRYSSDGMAFMLLMGVVVCLIATVIIRTQPIPAREKI